MMPGVAGIKLCVVLAYVVFVFSIACFISFLAAFVSSGEGVGGATGRGRDCAAACGQGCIQGLGRGEAKGKKGNIEYDCDIKVVENSLKSKC